MKFKIQQIADLIEGVVVGNAEEEIFTLAKIEEGKKGSLTFLANPKYTPYIYETEASAVIVNADFVPEKEIKATLIKVPDAYSAFAKLLAAYQEIKQNKVGVSKHAAIADGVKLGNNVYVGDFVSIAEGAVIGDNVRIYANTVIGSGVKIGKNTVLYAGVKIYDDCTIGENCTLHAGAVIGADGFGFAPQTESYAKVPQIGVVEIGNNVEIGANACVDRATMGATRIANGVKIDNLVQVAHNVEIGENTVIAAQAGIAGSTKVGKWCRIAGQVGIAGHLVIADYVQLGAQAGVEGSVKKEGAVYLGSPAMPARAQQRVWVYDRKLPAMVEKLEEILKIRL